MRIIEDVFPVSFSRFSMEKEADELEDHDKDNSRIKIKVKLQQTWCDVRDNQTTKTLTLLGVGEDKN